MSLVNEFIIGDLLQYMRINDCDILEELSFGNLDIIFDLVAMSRRCSDEEASELAMEHIRKYGLAETVKEIGKKVTGSINRESSETVEINGRKFSDILYEFYNEIQALDKNLSFSEFKAMSIDELHIYADGVRDRYILNQNIDFKKNYYLVGMFMSALVGKLKECPQLNIDGSIKQKSLHDRLREI